MANENEGNRAQVVIHPDGLTVKVGHPFKSHDEVVECLLATAVGFATSVGIDTGTLLQLLNRLLDAACDGRMRTDITEIEKSPRGGSA